jgi:5-(carboxyamino)imidazole ribonucleotide synthase
VRRLDSPDDLSAAVDQPSILERRIEFVKEISIIVARNRLGEASCYPPVDLVTHPEKHLLHYLAAPALIPEETREKADAIAVRLAEALGMVGILAVEMFVTPQGDVLVNEAAPRPHNSGHHTIVANKTSQFEQHLRAVLDLPLGSTEMISPALMFNLLGEQGYEGPVQYEGIAEALSVPDVHVFLYGKKNTKPFRKMGHITVLDKTIEKAKEKMQWLKQKVRVIA